jgi:anti-sigma factor RsiW
VSSGRWRISVTAPDWGQDHLSSDAIVAFVDDELAHGPHERATRHLAQCPECAAQVVAQGQARSALRAADCPSLPSSLLSSLRSIPQDTDLPAPPAGLAMSADGQFVAVLRPERRAGPERTDLVAAPGPDHDRRPPAQRRLRLGTGVAVSGLALGALAFGVPAASSVVSAPAPTADRGVLGGTVLGGPSGAVDARLRLGPTTVTAGRPELVADRLDAIPGSFRGLR